MATRIEPPFLMSRVLTLVLASAVVVLILLVVTLGKMFPLNRPQVFFLTSQPRDELELRLTEMPKNAENYKKMFIMEYIKARNEIIPDAALMQKRWGQNGIVDIFSDNSVFVDFVSRNNDVWYAVLQDTQNFPAVCSVEFPSETFLKFDADTYQVKFVYRCDWAGQTYRKDYTIKLKLGLQDVTKWGERLDNPLGLRVMEYSVLGGNNDPLAELGENK